MSMRSEPVRVMVPNSVKFHASLNGAALESSTTTSRFCAAKAAVMRAAYTMLGSPGWCGFSHIVQSYLK